MQTRSQLPVAVEIHGDPRTLPPAVTTALFRMAQEALTNNVKHANARHAWLRLRFGAEAVTLTIEDDGIGFDTRRQGTAGAWGLLGLEERANLLGVQLVTRLLRPAWVFRLTMLPWSSNPMMFGNDRATEREVWIVQHLDLTEESGSVYSVSMSRTIGGSEHAWDEFCTRRSTG